MVTVETPPRTRFSFGTTTTVAPGAAAARIHTYWTTCEHTSCRRALKIHVDALGRRVNTTAIEVSHPDADHLLIDSEDQGSLHHCRFNRTLQECVCLCGHESHPALDMGLYYALNSVRGGNSA